MNPRLQAVLVFGGVAALVAFFVRLPDGRTVAEAAADGIDTVQSTVTGTVGGALSGYGADGAMSKDAVLALAQEIADNYFLPNVDPNMAVAIAEIESSFRPTAYRLEVHVGDASTGLMQTLQKTAQWLWDIGYKAMPRPDAVTLLEPKVSMYFGMAYIDWLQGYKGEAHSEEWIIRAYNGGPGGATKAGTRAYWKKYGRVRFGIADIPAEW